MRANEPTVCNAADRSSLAFAGLAAFAEADPLDAGATDAAVDVGLSVDGVADATDDGDAEVAAGAELAAAVPVPDDAPVGADEAADDGEAADGEVDDGVGDDGVGDDGGADAEPVPETLPWLDSDGDPAEGALPGVEFVPDDALVPVAGKGLGDVPVPDDDVVVLEDDDVPVDVDAQPGGLADVEFVPGEMLAPDPDDDPVAELEAVPVP